MTRMTADDIASLEAEDFLDRAWLREIALQLASLNDTLDVLYDDHRNALRTLALDPDST